jgi:hypothetical protein
MPAAGRGFENYAGPITERLETFTINPPFRACLANDETLADRVVRD